jgi:hypothetical protein
MEAWFKILPSVNASLPPSAFPRLFHYNNLEEGQYSFGIVGDGSGGFPGVRTVWAAVGDGLPSGGVIKAAMSDAIEPSDDEEWYHFVATIEETEIRLWLNGEELEDLEDSDPVAWVALQATIGGRTQDDGATLVQGFPGLIDELAIYADILPEERIIAHYDAGTNPSVAAQQAPGDCNQDGMVDVSDSICMLGHLFLGSPEMLPCEGGAAASPGNLALVDFNGDTTPDLTDAVSMLTFLFGGGPAHVLGRECVDIEGCPDLCGAE